MGLQAMFVPAFLVGFLTFLAAILPLGGRK